MIDSEIDSLIREVIDFPKKSISFKDKWGHCDTILLLSYAVTITVTALVRKS